MARYVIKRILQMIPVVIAVAVLIFTVMYFCPGDPAAIILGDYATEAELAAKRAELGLDAPYIVQLGRFLYQLFIQHDLGTSYIYGVPVINEIANRFPNTLILALSTMVIRVVVGTPLGIAAAMHQNRFLDKFCMTISMVFISIPGFWLAMMLVQVFSLKLGWLPVYGIDTWQGWGLPIIASSCGGIALQARQTRSAMLEVIRSDYITTARAKGLPERVVVWKHALPNALIPLITMLGTGLALSLGGTMAIENIFSFPGMGSYLSNGITLRDYPIVRSVVVVLSIIFCVLMLLVDLGYAFVDPRIKAQYEGQSLRKKKGGKES